MSQKHILLLGAGLSSSVLIEYLLDQCQQHDWGLTIADKEKDRVGVAVQNNPRVKVASLDIRNEGAVYEAIKSSDLVISMVPAFFHDLVAKICLDCGRSMLTASYVTQEMREMDSNFRAKGLLLLGDLALGLLLPLLI